ncbi:hypothetical protein NQ314_015164 [Rhamnusium bicolor]|uniref:Myb-like, SWIRM and MPN domain-containing protein 1 n=1 Tax=Rhamnusium bicolor TaxID=1586634 RepID=A0AAV8X0G0_9CUCU|nr:hypothetical protein NQ314_015164 [Rhamnusium bicolor]
MAEEDEIDVLGDFNLDNFLVKNDSSIYGSASLVSQNSDLLNCDYTIHPQWLLDKPSANPDNWYDTNPSTGLLEKTQAESDTLGHVSTENSITDESGWTEKEKNLLERGIEIFGKSNVRLSQFIGSKTSAEVKYYLKNFYQENQNAYRNFNDGVVEEINDNNLNLVSDVLDDTQIPASIEEVIAAVSTAKPTVQLHKRARKKSSSFNNDFVCDVNLKDIPSGQSLLKSNYMKTDTHSVRDLKLKKYELNAKQRLNKCKSVKFKFKTNLKMSVKENKCQIKQKTIKVKNDQNKKTEFSKVEITTGKGLAVPICEGEEIVKIKNVDNDSDLDIEIDVEDTDEEVEEKTLNTTKSHQQVVQTQSTMDNRQEDIKNTDMESGQDNTELDTKQWLDFSTLNELTVKELMSLEKPDCEIILDESNVTELEKVIHSEFFEGRPTKTPSRYLKQPYTIKVHLSTLLTMDFHAHTSLTEVMGLVAGYWIPQNKILTISHYEPCLNIASSATHCDMCPISQAKAADIIHNKGLDILGWFHSHPTFAPEPSHQDIETQQVLQQWVGHNRPCIGVILSPFSLNGALIASPFRCLIVDKKMNFEDQIVPYKFKVELVSEDFDVKEFLRDIQEVFRADVGYAKERKVKFSKPYFQDSSITHLEKYITSVRMHLAKCGTLNKTTCDKIIQGISDICSNNKMD